VVATAQIPVDGSRKLRIRSHMSNGSCSNLPFSHRSAREGLAALPLCECCSDIKAIRLRDTERFDSTCGSVAFSGPCDEWEFVPAILHHDNVADAVKTCEMYGKRFHFTSAISRSRLGAARRVTSIFKHPSNLVDMMDAFGGVCDRSGVEDCVQSSLDQHVSFVQREAASSSANGRDPNEHKMGVRWFRTVDLTRSEHPASYEISSLFHHRRPLWRSPSMVVLS